MNNKGDIIMALKIINGKVKNISPPSNLTKKQLKKIKNTPINKTLIQSALSREYNIVYARA